VKLCRCGHSGKKPYCDETHRRVDFVSRPSFLPEPVEER
jgi:CDGSH-type Zn-finger protein